MLFVGACGHSVFIFLFLHFVYLFKLQGRGAFTVTYCAVFDSIRQHASTVMMHLMGDSFVTVLFKRKLILTKSHGC